MSLRSRANSAPSPWILAFALSLLAWGVLPAIGLLLAPDVSILFALAGLALAWGGTVVLRQRQQAQRAADGLDDLGLLGLESALALGAVVAVASLFVVAVARS